MSPELSKCTSFISSQVSTFTEKGKGNVAKDLTKEMTTNVLVNKTEIKETAKALYDSINPVFESVSGDISFAEALCKVPSTNLEIKKSKTEKIRIWFVSLVRHRQACSSRLEGEDRRGFFFGVRKDALQLREPARESCKKYKASEATTCRKRDLEEVLKDSSSAVVTELTSSMETIQPLNKQDTNYDLQTKCSKSNNAEQQE